MTDIKEIIKAKEIAICRTCGSADIYQDATSYWDSDEQEWMLSDCNGLVTCNRCGTDTKWGPNYVALDGFKEPDFYMIRAMIEQGGEWIDIYTLPYLDNHSALDVEFCVYTLHNDEYDQTSNHVGDFTNIEEAIQCVRDKIGDYDFETRCLSQPRKEIMELPRVYKTEDNKFILTNWNFEKELSGPVDDVNELKPICAAILKSMAAS